MAAIERLTLNGRLREIEFSPKSVKANTRTHS
jgi:hypothetical protein